MGGCQTRLCRWSSRRTRLGLGCRCFRGLVRLCSSFLRGQFLKVLPHLLRVVQVERTGVRLLFRDADLRQVVDQDFRLDLEFPGQLIDSNLIRV